MWERANILNIQNQALKIICTSFLITLMFGFHISYMKKKKNLLAKYYGVFIKDNLKVFLKKVITGCKWILISIWIPELD